MIVGEENTVRTAKKSGRRAVLIVAIVCGLALAGSFALITRAQRPSVVAATAVQTERVTIAIEGMHCGGCASGIRAMLKRTAGVVSADVSHERKEAVVEYDPGRVTREKIVEAITNLGYKASVKG